MKRRDLIAHLSAHGCLLRREGARHSVYWNPETGECTAVPRHREINEITAKKICKVLGLPLF